MFNYYQLFTSEERREEICKAQNMKRTKHEKEKRILQSQSVSFAFLLFHAVCIYYASRPEKVLTRLHLDQVTNLLSVKF